jgi:lysophospholipase L1-like esterase
MIGLYNRACGRASRNASFLASEGNERVLGQSMMTRRSLGFVLRWWACLPALPLLVLQAKRLRKRIPRLPEAAGPRLGESHVSPEVGTLRIAIVGESTAVGVGASSLDEALPGHLARALAAQTRKNVAWSILGGNGMTAKRVLSSVRAEHQGRYDCAVVLLGVNDVFRMTPVKAWLLDLRLLAKSLAERGCEVIVFSAVPPVGQFPALPQPLRAILGLRAALLDYHLQKLAKELPGAIYCPVRFPSDQAHVATDGVHPSSSGYRDWARQLASVVSASAVGSPAAGGLANANLPPSSGSGS